MAAVKISCPTPLQRIGDDTGESGDNAGAGHAGNNAQRHPAATPGHARRGGKDNTDDQAGFENFTENDKQARQHAPDSCGESFPRPLAQPSEPPSLNCNCYAVAISEPRYCI